MKTVKVLVIDDDPMTCNLIETILQMEKYETASAHAIGSEGIVPLLDSETPDIIVLDFHLGAQETVQFVVEIRSSKGWQQLPILMTSAIDRSKSSLDAGANEFLLKPFNWQEMTELINKLRDDFIYQEA